MKSLRPPRGEDIIDFGMGNPDGATPKHIVDKLVEAALKPATHRYSVSRGIPRLRKAICNWYKTPLRRRSRPRDRGHRHHRLQGGHRPPLPGHPRLARHGAVPNPSYPIHIYGPVIAGAHVQSASPVHDQEQFLASLRPDPAHDPAPQGC
jgi:alanine-synthesizing transaminase